MAQPWGGPPEGLLGEPDGVLQVEPAGVDAPGKLQIRRAARGAGPPQPQHLGWARLGGDALDLDAQDGAAHDRPRPPRAMAGVAVLLGVQPRPRGDGHRAVLVIDGDEAGGRGRPGGRIGEGELGAMAARTAAGARWAWRRIVVEAAVGPE